MEREGAEKAKKNKHPCFYHYSCVLVLSWCRKVSGESSLVDKYKGILENIPFLSVFFSFSSICKQNGAFTKFLLKILRHSTDTLPQPGSQYQHSPVLGDTRLVGELWNGKRIFFDMVFSCGWSYFRIQFLCWQFFLYKNISGKGLKSEKTA